ncbi:MAG TPA: TAT-variant-translocated molybdopterin oxidoreductase [Vicinamibacterales bacterium]|nr:TAT-variant-translocated molybdopterin oxidoreductase [Vicinamibacterales bacterium]
MTYADIRTRLASPTTPDGPAYWRSLDELANTEEFQDFVAREFPSQASEFNDPAGRRQFLKLMGASLALAGVSACTRQPDEMIVPYVRQPEEVIPGRPIFFATSMTAGGFGMPLLAENHLGRPTKLEGNPQHPASLGATDIFGQAAVLGLYDPDRSRTLRYRGDTKTWAGFTTALQAVLNTQKALSGAGLRILTEPLTSPTLVEQIQTLLTVMPEAKWHQWDAVYGTVQGGAPTATPLYQFKNADIVVSLDADFLGFGPASVRYTKDFSSRRRIGTPKDQQNRLYVVEPVPTLTGTKAAHRLAVKARDVHSIAAALAAAVGVAAPSAGTLSEAVQKVMPIMARDLMDHRGRSVVVAGPHQPASVHALARAMNEALGNVGTTVVYTAPVAATPADGAASLTELVGDMNASKVDVLLILGGNPVFTTPGDIGFSDALAKVGTRIHLGLYFDETAELCDWHVPEAHFLESWGDARAFDGTITLQQPLIAPLYDGRQAVELLSALNGAPGRSPVELVKDYWTRTFATGGFTDASGAPFATVDAFWRAALHDGFIASTSLMREGAVLPAAPANSAFEAATAPVTGLEIVFRPDPTVLDGRYANNGWLQELPKPLSKLTWDNVVYVSYTTAEAHHLKNEDVIEITSNGRTVKMPVWVMPGTADDVLVVHFGYGRRKAGRVGSNIGSDPFVIRTAQAPWFTQGASFVRTGETHPLASTQSHFAMEGRNPVRIVDAAAFQADPTIVKHMGHTPGPEMTLYPPREYNGNKWGMAIDLNACTGCGVCIAACVAENNIPVVGKTQIKRSREMHWIRVDTYFEGDPASPTGTYHQPLPCQQCENAPCEVVCPVAATVHSDEGLNDMVYNRCVGTRYCSNNCPYKVRRFNFMLYSDFTTPELKAQRNPDVTIRSRGVMEKCTYCVQRINHARIDAKTAERPIADGEIQTACQQACPAEAIVFGDLNMPDSQVSKLAAQDRNYGLLEELGSRPRTTYLAVVRNPNPALPSETPVGTKTSGH